MYHSLKPSAGRQGADNVNAKAHQLTLASENTEDEVPCYNLGKVKLDLILWTSRRMTCQ